MMKRIFGKAVRYSGIMHLYPQSGKSILMYHRVAPSGPLVSATPEMFEKQMRYIKANFQVTGLDDTRSGVAITFDDGYMDNYTYAYPILKRLGLPATIFLATGFIGGKRNFPWEKEPMQLDWKEVAEMFVNRISFGAHTVNHPDLTKIPFLSAQKEILDSKHEIEHHIDQTVDVFAYPYGISNKKLDGFLKKHFRHACTTEYGRERSHGFRLRRIGIEKDDDMELFRIKLLGVGRIPAAIYSRWK